MLNINRKKSSLKTRRLVTIYTWAMALLMLVIVMTTPNDTDWRLGFFIAFVGYLFLAGYGTGRYFSKQTTNIT